VRLLVCYDVRTETTEGEKRLRRIARICVNHGQRVQKSVFECVLTDSQFEGFRRQLLDVLVPAEDNLRMYPLAENVETIREIHGLCRDVDFDGPLGV